jgi:hypothetical protein
MVACTAGSSSTIRILATASPANTIFESMLSCEAVVLRAQAVPQKSAHRVLKKQALRNFLCTIPGRPRRALAGSE